MGYPGNPKTREKYVKDVEKLVRKNRVNRIALLFFALVIIVPILLEVFKK